MSKTVLAPCLVCMVVLSAACPMSDLVAHDIGSISREIIDVDHLDESNTPINFVKYFQGTYANQALLVLVDRLRRINKYMEELNYGRTDQLSDPIILPK